MDQRVFVDPNADARRGAWIAVAFIGIIAVIALILAGLAYGRAQPAVGSWKPLPLNFSGVCGPSFIVNASGQTNGNEAKLIVPIFSCDGTCIMLNLD